MKYNTATLVYFSATDTTKQIVEHIVQGIQTSDNIIKYDITQGQDSNVSFGNNDIVIFGFPVYAGRIPQLCIEHINKFKGNNTPAIIVCVYGNREYDDALLELRDIIVANGFSIISAGAFVAQHSIFTEVAKNRPDASDCKKAIEFGKESIEKLNQIEDAATIHKIEVNGNYPYKELVASAPLVPCVDDAKCNECGRCATLCPTGAIDKQNPKKTNGELCISCGRCIYQCPHKAKSFDSETYRAKAIIFGQMNARRKEPEIVFAI